MTDLLDRFAGVAPEGAVDALRRHRPVTREHAQASYDALFTSFEPEHASLAERAAVAQFVAALHADDLAAAHYGALAREAAGDGLADLIAELAVGAAATGPYGAYPAEGPLVGESVDGLRWAVPADARATLGERLSAALEHTHLLVFRPREASADALRALAAAGWSADGIVTLSQLVSFLAFQLRVAAGLRLLTTEEAAA